MSYAELAVAARGNIGPFCKACPVCDGRACAGVMPGPGDKGVGHVAEKSELSEKAYLANNKTVTRTYGDDRYETNKFVMEKYAKTWIASAKHVYVASGADFADALTGGVLAAVNECPLVLVNPTETEYAHDIVEKVEGNTGYGGLIVIGGENAVSNATVQKIA